MNVFKFSDKFGKELGVRVIAVYTVLYKGSFYSRCTSYIFSRALGLYDQGEIDKVDEQLDLLPGLSELSEWSITDKLQQSNTLFMRAASIIQQHKINNHK